MRLFIALEIEETLRAAAVETRARLERELRMHDPAPRLT